MSNINIPGKTLFLDTETTGRFPPRDHLVEISFVDENRNVVMNTLINPGRSIGDAKKIHGITDEMVSNAPTFRELWPVIEALVTGCHVVIYNSEFDTQFFPERMRAAAHISCAMQRFAGVYGDWNPYHQSFSWKSLKVAMEYVEGTWEGTPHRALSDALACQTVWAWLDDNEQFQGQLPTKSTEIRSLF